MRWRTLALAALLWSPAHLLTAAFENPGEYEIKAAFLFNFAKFVLWPDAAFADSSSPIIIAVGGDDPFGDVLPELVRDKTAHGRPIRIRHFPRVQDVEFCHILFVAAGEEQERWLEAVELRDQAGTLTVGEGDRFWELGGAITFVLEKRRVRFAINPEAAARSGLELSARLLALGRRIGGGTGKGDRP